MKKEKLIKTILVSIGIMLALFGCNNQSDTPESDLNTPDSELNAPQSDPVSNKTSYNINLNELDPQIVFWDNFDYDKNFQCLIDITQYFAEKWPKAGDTVTITYTASPSANISAVYSNVVDSSEKANYWMYLVEEQDVLFANNLQEDKTFSSKVTFTFNKAPFDNVTLHLFYWSNDFCNISSFNTGDKLYLGEASPATCDFIGDFKNTTTHPLGIIAFLYFDNTLIEISKPKMILPNGSTRFYCDFKELEKKYGTKLYSNQTAFWCRIIQPGFTWTDSKGNNYTWNEHPFWVGGVNPGDLNGKIQTVFEAAINNYNASDNTYSHDYINHPDNELRLITDEDRQIPNLTFTNTRVQFDYNYYGPNYQTFVQLFDEPLKAGDKIKLNISGIPEDSIKDLSLCIADNSAQAPNYWLVLSKEAENSESSIKNLTKGQSFNFEYTFEIVNDSVAYNSSDIKLALKYELDDLNKATSIKNCTISVEKL